MNLKHFNGNGTIKASMVVDWVFRILCLTLPFVIAVMLNIEHRVTIVETTHYSLAKGNELQNKVVRLEEKCRGYEKDLADLQRQIDQLEGH